MGHIFWIITWQPDTVMEPTIRHRPERVYWSSIWVEPESSNQKDRQQHDGQKKKD
jgi:hypothetical protein